MTSLICSSIVIIIIESKYFTEVHYLAIHLIDTFFKIAK